MSLFKDKPLKKITGDNRVTIDVTHNNKLKNILEKKEYKKLLEKEYDNLNKKYNELDSEDIIQLSNIKRKLKLINNEDYYNYYFNTGELLSEYYNDSKLIKDKSNDNIIKKYNNIIDFKKTTNQYQTKCEKCNQNYILKLKESEIYCENCGITHTIIINSEKNNYKDPPRENSYFAYKRINHFNEWIAQFQAKESTDIPIEVYKKIKIELNKEMVSGNNISFTKIKNILKKLKLNKYYEHSVHIMNYLNGETKPVLSYVNEERLRNMFQEIQTPFLNHCPETRKNFLSYSYVLHKFCELLELDELLIYFPYLKSREKLQQQDMIWKNICKDLQWQYIPSI